MAHGRDVIDNAAGLQLGQHLAIGEDVIVAGCWIDGPPGKAVIVGVKVAKAVGVARPQQAGDGQAKDKP